MNINYTPLRITLTGQFAAALRLAACTDKRTMTAFLEVVLPSIPAFAEALKTAEVASLRSSGLVVDDAPSVPASVEVPGAPWVPLYKRPGYVGPGSEKP